MVPRLNRLPHTTRLSRSERISTPFFTTKLADNDLSLSRFGVVVSKKVSKSAVKRNHARRLLQACFMEALPHFVKDVDILCIAHPTAGEATHAELSHTFREILEKRGLLK